MPISIHGANALIYYIFPFVFIIIAEYKTFPLFVDIKYWLFCSNKIIDSGINFQMACEYLFNIIGNLWAVRGDTAQT